MNDEQQGKDARDPQEVLEKLTNRVLRGDEPAVVGPGDPRKTVFDLQELIQRCFNEAKEAGLIKKAAREFYDDAQLPIGQTLIINERDLVKHIALTIVGELHEFEVIRRIAPLFREVNRLQSDFRYFEEREAADQQMRSLRIRHEG